MRLRPAAASAFIVAALLLYAPRLDQRELTGSEVALARQAYSIAQTGRDLDGQLLPLFVHSEAERWLAPLPAYAAAIAVAAVPASPVAVRWPSVLIGAVVVALVYWIALRLFASEPLAALAAGLLLLTPAHYTFSRVAEDGIFALSFVLVAVAAILSFLEDRRSTNLWIAGLTLGVGFYSGTTSPLLMATYLALMMLVLGLAGHRDWSVHLSLAAGFLGPLLLLVPWFAMNPESYPDTLGRWALHAAHIRNPLEGVRAIINWGSLTNRASIYWEFLNPAFLFFPGEESAGANRAAGPMVASLMILVPFGIARIARVCSTAIATLLLVGVLAAPFAAATFSENHALGRALTIIPFAVLIATFGVEALWSSTSRIARAAAVLLASLAVLQFGWFWLS